MGVSRHCVTSQLVLPRGDLVAQGAHEELLVAVVANLCGNIG